MADWNKSATELKKCRLRDEYRIYLRVISAGDSNFELENDRKATIYLTQLGFMYIFVVCTDFADHNGILKAHQSQTMQEQCAILFFLARENPRLGSVAGLNETFRR